MALLGFLSSLRQNRYIGLDDPGNSTNETWGRDDFDHSAAVSTMVQIILFLALGIFGNTLIIVIFWDQIRKHRRTARIRTPPNTTIIVLAFCDLALLTVYVPSYTSYVYGLFTSFSVCLASQFLLSFVTAFTHLVLTVAVPIERLLAIWCPRDERFELTLCKSALMYGCFAVLSASAGISVTTITADDTRLSGSFECQVHMKDELAFITATGAVYTSTSVFAVICYVLIGIKVSRVRRAVREIGPETKLNRKSDSSSQRSALTGQLRIVWMMVIVMLVYTAAWMPYVLAHLNVIPNNYLYWFFHIFNNATNFIVYAVISSRFRKDMWKKLACKEPSFKRRTNT